jgi:hypothetical protein
MNDLLYNWHIHFIYVIIGYVYVIIRLFLQIVLNSGMNDHDFLCVCAYLKRMCLFLGRKKGLPFFSRKIGLFSATFIPMSAITCYSQQNVPDSQMNVPHFLVICHF